MDRLNSTEPGRVDGRVWRRYCPRCAAPTTARLAAVRGPYESLVRRLLHKQRLECGVCGLRLSGLASLETATPERRAPLGSRFLKPSDGRGSSRLLRDLRTAELDRELGAPVRPIGPRRGGSVDD